MTFSARIRLRLEECADRHTELEGLLGDSSIVANQAKYTELSREYSRLQPIVDAYSRFNQLQQELNDATELAQSPDSDMKALAAEIVQELQPQLDAAGLNIELMLLPGDPDDHANVYLEIRAGTGGDEAALFASDLVKMYEKYSTSKGWEAQLISLKSSTQGGCKEAIFRVSGQDVFARLKFESGTHRVQRVPITESQGRIHTSACTVAILPEVEEITEIEIKDSDLRIDTYRASGAGGQHVNKTDSAVRITHLPSGTVAECQDERSQHLNRARALALLQAKLVNEQKQEQEQERTLNRKLQVGSGDRSERIRTYNFPQGRLTDHRVNLTLYKLDEILEGALDQVIEPLIKEHQADLLKELHADHTPASFT